MPDEEKYFINTDDVFLAATKLLWHAPPHIIIEIPEVKFSEISFEEAVELAKKMKAFETEAQIRGYNKITKLEDDTRNLIIYDLIRDA